MALTAILSMETDVRPFFGSTACDDNNSLLDKLRKWTESQARKFVGHGIIQATYTEYQRRQDIGFATDSDIINVIGDKVYLGNESSCAGEILQLDNGFIRSVTSVYEDWNGRFGFTGDFAAGTALAEGTDFYIERENASFGLSGRLIRYYRQWSPRPGTIKVTYVAGLSAAELDDEYSFVKLALLLDLRAKFNHVLAQRSAVGAGGPIKKETYFGDYAVEYDTSSSHALQQLSPEAKASLQPIKRIAL